MYADSYAGLKTKGLLNTKPDSRTFRKFILAAKECSCVTLNGIKGKDVCSTRKIRFGLMHEICSRVLGYEKISRCGDIGHVSAGSDILEKSGFSIAQLVATGLEHLNYLYGFVDR